VDNSTGAIAFFDFDGTITTSDTLLEIIKYACGKRAFWIGFGKMSPWLVAMKAGWVSNNEAKQKVLRYFFGGWPQERFGEICAGFIEDRMPGLLRPGAMEKIGEYRREGIPVVVVSASPQDLVERWCREQGLDCIATRLEVRDQQLTGRIEGTNCYGEEKVRRIRERFDLRGFSAIYAYGDSRGDEPMLAIATKAFYKPFRP
jgi:phosphatidylglycerophosphatase C